MFRAALLAALVAVPSLAAAQTFPSVTGGTGPGSAAYVMLGPGANTTGTGIVSLLAGATSSALFGTSGGLPLLRCDYIGQSYSGVLHGNYSLATTAPGTVTAIEAFGTSTISTPIGNLLAGTPGQWWDAESDIVCLSAGGSSVTISVATTLTFQAAGGVTAAQPINRANGTTLVVNGATSGAFVFDLRRNFTNGANTMQIETLSLDWIR